VSADTRREALLDATRRVIGRAGFAGATVGEITREAGASLGLLHYHFESKDEVVAEAFADAAREDLASLEAISRRHEHPADRLAAYLDESGWEDAESWRLWVDAWGESVHTPLVRDTVGRYDVGWRAVLAEVLVDGVRAGCWQCEDPQDTAARLVAVIDGIGLHTTLHGEDVPPARATAWARRLAELELGVTLPAAPAPLPALPPVAPHATRIAIRARDLDARGRVDPAVLFTYLEEARDAWLGERVPEATVTHVAVGFRRSLSRADAPVTVSCGLDAVGRASFRTRETVVTAGGAAAVEAATTLAVAGRALTAAEREALVS
jgi:AcrR family transcriptional regulator/acyl-CoA thioesterase FadM